jgi:hypothetical protein
MQVDAFLTAKGIYLDSIGAILGIERKRYWWFFRESDKKMRNRCLAVMYKININ